MPVLPTYPGVYIEEIPSEVRTVMGVSTSITAFVGYTARGPVNKAVRIHNVGDFNRIFGGYHRESLISYAVNQFFLNGGSDAYVVRVAKNAGKSQITLKDDVSGGNDVLTVIAADEGAWGNYLKLKVDYTTSNPDSLFNLAVSLYELETGSLTLKQTEQFRNLSMNSHSGAYVENVVNSGSNLITVQRASGLSFTTGYALSQDLSSFPALLATDNTISGVLDGDRPFTLVISPATPPNNLTTLQSAIASAINTAGLASDMEATVDGNAVKLASKHVADYASVHITKALSHDLAAKIGLGVVNGGKEVEGAAARRPATTGGGNVSQYELGVGISEKAQSGAVLGKDGDPPGATEIMGESGKKTGIYALRDVDLFNILVIPRTTRLSDTEAKSVLSAAMSLCEEERAFLLVDPDPNKGKDDIVSWINSVGSSKNAAIFFPQVMIADPLDGYRLKAMPPSGAVAGVMARTDSQRGVWKAPAGIEATLRNVQALSYVLTDPENGDLNQNGVNCLRSFETYGRVIWGSRTLFGADKKASEWKYIPVRRLALFIEESLYRGTQWVVFEPNDEPLWSQIRLNVGAFMHDLFRQGAFQGQTPREAYFVKCDKETTTQNDINKGIVNILVGFAPLKPAEFVIIQFSQIAGQVQA